MEGEGGGAGRWERVSAVTYTHRRSRAEGGRPAGSRASVQSICIHAFFASVFYKRCSSFFFCVWCESGNIGCALGRCVPSENAAGMRGRYTVYGSMTQLCKINVTVLRARGDRGGGGACHGEGSTRRERNHSVHILHYSLHVHSPGRTKSKSKANGAG